MMDIYAGRLNKDLELSKLMSYLPKEECNRIQRILKYEDA